MWHIDVLKSPTGIVDIGLIWDEANKLAPNRGPRAEVQPLGESLAATVEQAQGVDQGTSEPTSTIPVESILGTAPPHLQHWSRC